VDQLANPYKAIGKVIVSIVLIFMFKQPTRRQNIRPTIPQTYRPTFIMYAVLVCFYRS
jgi:hypothetical protein